MADKNSVQEIITGLPDQVFKRLIEDIPVKTWAEILRRNPNVKSDVLGGFSFKLKKLERSLFQTAIMSRLQRHLHGNPDLFEQVLHEWGDEFVGVRFMAMLDMEFVLARWRQLRDLLGPERFCLGLLYLGAFEDEEFAALIGYEGFWTRAPDRSMFELLLVPLATWGKFIRENPEAAERITREFGPDQTMGLNLMLPRLSASGQTVDELVPRTEPETGEPSGKLVKKLEKTRSELSHVSDQLAHAKMENEELKSKLKVWEAGFERKLHDSAAKLRSEWFSRYSGVELEKLSSEAARLEPLAQRTRRALELQAKADEEYGLISDIRARMLEIDLSLAKIESVHANSLVVHKEVDRVKEALLEEKQRLLRLPGIGKVIGTAPEGAEAELASRINLLEPLPGNLPKLNRLKETVRALAASGILDDPAPLEEAVSHKKKQVLERLYSNYSPSAASAVRKESFRSLDDFVRSGESRRYALFVDGYNVLLRVHEGNEDLVRRGFTELRERFIEAASRKSGHFAKVFLVFDGVQSSRENRGNTEIVYTDRRAKSADAAIVERVRARKDEVLLVTADEAIISAVSGRTFALIDPVDFYMFVFE